MAKDKELPDHRRAHSGKSGSKVDHGYRSFGRDGSSEADEKEELDRNYVHDAKSTNSLGGRDFGYRRIWDLAHEDGGRPMSQRTVRKHLKTYEPPGE